MLIGAHVSAAGGLWNAPENAAALGCETFQFFTRSPQGGQPPPLTEEVVKRFRDACEKHEFARYAAHAPYFINFASSASRIRKGTLTIIRQELERCSLLGAEFLMAHLGSAKDMGEEAAMKAVIEGVTEVMEGYRGGTRFLIEIAAGAGAVIGDTFEEIAAIIEAVPIGKGTPEIGVCFDTQHAFASGYDLRTPEAVKEVLKKLDKTIGLDRVFMTHANDSKVAFGARRDRHEHIGSGEIGAEGFRALLADPRLKNWLAILETPWDGREKEDIATLKKLRDKK